MFQNICLVGIPHSGKSRLGKLLSQRLYKGFIETDKMIENNYKTTVSELVKLNNAQEFLHIENKIIKSIDCENTVISTGGSAVYNTEAMKHLKYNLSCNIIHLYISFDEWIRRMKTFEERGIINVNNVSMVDFYEDRIYHCEKYKDIRIDMTDSKIDCHEIIKKLESVEINRIVSGVQDYCI